MQLTIKKDFSEQIARIHCNTCSTITKHNIHATISEYWDDQDADYSIQGNINHQVLSCLGCDTFSYRSVSTNSEDYHIVNELGDAEYTETVNYFPPRSTGRAAIRDVSLLPQKLQTVYIETLAAHNAQQLVLTAIGLRTLIETMCKDHDAEGKNLEQRIDSLREKKIITEAACKILHRVRFDGNNAAHEAKAANIQTLGFAIEAIEHTLTGTYILPHREQLAYKQEPQPEKPNFSVIFNKDAPPPDSP